MEFWWNNMLTLQKVLFIVACATTLIMVIQIILMLVGAGSNGCRWRPCRRRGF